MSVLLEPASNGNAQDGDQNLNIVTYNMFYYRSI